MDKRNLRFESVILLFGKMGKLVRKFSSTTDVARRIMDDRELKKEDRILIDSFKRREED